MVLELSQISTLIGIPIWLLVVAIVWSLAWKAVALWTSARNNHLIWFVLILIINTLGILEILYIFLFSKLKLEEKQGRKKRR